MKKLIAIIVIMFGFMSTANAEIMGMMLTKAEVTSVIMEAIPIVNQKEIDNCYDAMKNDGFYKIHSSRVRIVCSKNELTRVWIQ